MHLARQLRTTDYFTLGFGTMVGVGWLVVMDDWLGRGAARARHRHGGHRRRVTPDPDEIPARRSRTLQRIRIPGAGTVGSDGSCLEAEMKLEIGKSKLENQNSKLENRKSTIAPVRLTTLLAEGMITTVWGVTQFLHRTGWP